MNSLSDIQLEALKELINIGVGKSAQVLNTLIDSHINLQVPEFFLYDASNVHQYIEQYEETKYNAVTLEFSGELSGRTKLILSSKEAGYLANTFTGEHLDDASLDSVRVEVLNEIGNILLNSIMGAIVNILNTHLDYVVPEFTEGSIESLIGHDGFENTTILSFKTFFDVSDLEIRGNILIFFEMNSFINLENSINTFLKSMK